MKTLCLMLAALTLVACARVPSPYVNIPSQKGDVAMHDPNRRGVRLVMLRSLEYVLAERPLDQPFQVMLPTGTSAQAYAEILPQLNDNAMWASDGQTRGLPIVAVTQVRIRGTSAEVDVVRPSFPQADQPSAQTVTVHLNYNPVDSWYAVRLREWRGSVPATASPVGEAAINRPVGGASQGE
jgi:hypothetical protein